MFCSKQAKATHALAGWQNAQMSGSAVERRVDRMWDPGQAFVGGFFFSSGPLSSVRSPLRHQGEI
jgi:hypothetical protein